MFSLKTERIVFRFRPLLPPIGAVQTEKAWAFSGPRRTDITKSQLGLPLFLIRVRFRDRVFLAGIRSAMGRIRPDWQNPTRNPRKPNRYGAGGGRVPWLCPQNGSTKGTRVLSVFHLHLAFVGPTWPGSGPIRVTWHPKKIAVSQDR